MPPDTARLSGLLAHPLRLKPGEDLRDALRDRAEQAGWQAVFIVAGIGSLRPVALRLAGAETPTLIDDDAELLTLSGTFGSGGVHLHASVALADGRVLGGHVGPGCRVRTTAELLLAVLPAHRFDREDDAETGCRELVVRPRSG